MQETQVQFWRRQWHPTPVLLPGKSHGQRSLVGCSPWGREGSDTTEWVHFAFHFPALEKEMATHSSVLAWRIPGIGEPGGLPSMGSHRVRHDWSDLAAAAADNVRMKKSSLNTFSTLLKHRKRTLSTNYYHIKTMVKNKICNNKSEVWPSGSQVIISRSQKYSKALEITKISKIFFKCYANIHTEIYIRRWCFGRPYTRTRIQVLQH